MTASSLLQGHIVAEVCDLDNEPLVKMVGVEHVQTVVSHDIIGRLMIQCARQHGLAAVWQKIMGFEGADSSLVSTLRAWSVRQASTASNKCDTSAGQKHAKHLLQCSSASKDGLAHP